MGFADLGFKPYGGFPRLGVPFLGDNIVRIVVFRGLYWGTIYREITILLGLGLERANIGGRSLFDLRAEGCHLPFCWTAAKISEDRCKVLVVF